MVFYFFLTDIPNEELGTLGFTGQGSDFLAIEADRRHLEDETTKSRIPFLQCAFLEKHKPRRKKWVTDRVDVLIELQPVESSRLAGAVQAEHDDLKLNFKKLLYTQRNIKSCLECI